MNKRGSILALRDAPLPTRGVPAKEVKRYISFVLVLIVTYGLSRMCCVLRGKDFFVGVVAA